MMFFHATQASRPSRKVDFMAGSERMLKAHHRNAVFLKSLENKKSKYDSSCNKNLSKMQQEIYGVYFNEYLPLKEQANRTKGCLPRISNTMLPKLCKPAKSPAKETKLELPKINSLSLVSSTVSFSGRNNNLGADNVLDLLRERQRDGQNENNRMHISESGMSTSLIQQSLNGVPGERKRNAYSSFSMWHGSMSDTSDTPPIDEKRLNILKTAIALTSQPAKTPEIPRRPKRLRRSFLVNLRRQSKVVWEDEMLKRIGGPFKKRDSEDRKESNGTEITIPEPINQKWRPSISKNRILNDDDDDEDKDEMIFNFVDRETRASLESILSERRRRSPPFSARTETTYHDTGRDWYHPESSPDMFSVISEHSGSYYTDSSYTSDSEYSSSEYSYWSDTDM